MSHNAHEQLPTPRSSGQRSGVSREGPKRWAATAALLTLALGHVAQAADGQLDPSFDGDGLVTLDVGDKRNELQAVAVQPDGKIVAAGSVGIVTSRNFAVAGFNPDGSLDFINSTIDVSGENDRDFAEGLALQADGKIVLAGQSGPDGEEQFAVARYNRDGSLDDGGFSDSTPGDEFGVNGTMLTPFAGGRSIARDVTVQRDGKIVVVGQFVTGTGAPEESAGDFAVARYNSDGSLDTSFDGDGRVTTNVFPDNEERGRDVAVQPDGKIVVVGFGGATSPGFDEPLNDFVLLRYNPDGSLDRSFDGDGIVTTAFGVNRNDQAAAVIIQPDGKLVAAGESGREATDVFALARYNADGGLDVSFGQDGNGKQTTDFPDGTGGRAFDLVLQSGGKLVAAGFRVFGDASPTSATQP